MSEHTELPWAVSSLPPIKISPTLYAHRIYCAHNFTPARGYGRTPERATANAEYIVRACNAHEDLVKELQSALEDFESEPVQCVGDWERGLFCGLEDRGINDRYEACRHGYEMALEKVQEWVLCSFEDVIAKATE